MSYPTYDFGADLVNGEVFDAAHVNELRAAIEEIAAREFSAAGGTGGRGSYDVIIVNDSGTYRAYSPSGAELSASTTLGTVWTAIAAANRHIHLARGSFTTAGTLSLSSGMRVTGEGRTLTVITKTGSGELFDGDTVSNVTLAHLAGVGPSTSGSQVAGSGVYFDTYSHVDVIDCEFSGFGANGDDAGVRLGTGTYAHIEGCRLHDNKNGICTGSPGSSAITSARGKVIANFCYSNYDDGIHGQRSQYMTWQANVCWGHPNGGASDGAGLDLLGDEYDVVQGNLCFLNARGIELGNTAETAYYDIGHQVIGNQCIANTVYGLTIIAGFRRGTVSYNTVAGSGTDGIRFGTATSGQEVIDVTIAFNQIHSNGGRGIDLFGYNTRANVIFNFLSGHSTADIAVRTSTGTPAGYALIDNRTMSGTGISDSVNAGDKVQRLFGA